MAAQKENVPWEGGIGERPSTISVPNSIPKQSRIPIATSRRNARPVLQNAKVSYMGKLNVVENSKPSTVNVTTKIGEMDNVSDKQSDDPIEEQFVPDPTSLIDILNEKPISSKKFNLRESLSALQVDPTTPACLRLSMYRKNRDSNYSTMTPGGYERRINHWKEKMAKSSISLTHRMCSLKETTPLDELKLKMDFSTESTLTRSPSCPSLNTGTKSTKAPYLESRLTQSPSLPELNSQRYRGTLYHDGITSIPLHSSLLAINRNQPTTPSHHHYCQVVPTSSSHESPKLNTLSFYDVEEELVMLNSKTAPKPCGLTRDNCPNPIAKQLVTYY